MNDEDSTGQFDFGKVFSCSLDLISTESDRGAVLVSASLLEHNLERAIKKRLLPTTDKADKLFGGAMAPLSTFSGRIEMAFRLGIITKESKQMLTIFRGIRNDMAHNFNFSSFEDQSVKARLQNAFKEQKETHEKVLYVKREAIRTILEERGSSLGFDARLLDDEWPMRQIFNYFFALIATELEMLVGEISEVSRQSDTSG